MFEIDADLHFLNNKRQLVGFKRSNFVLVKQKPKFIQRLTAVHHRVDVTTMRNVLSQM